MNVISLAERRTKVQQLESDLAGLKVEHAALLDRYDLLKSLTLGKDAIIEALRYEIERLRDEVMRHRAF